MALYQDINATEIKELCEEEAKRLVLDDTDLKVFQYKSLGQAARVTMRMLRPVAERRQRGDSLPFSVISDIDATCFSPYSEELEQSASDGVQRVVVDGGRLDDILLRTDIVKLIKDLRQFGVELHYVTARSRRYENMEVNTKSELKAAGIDDYENLTLFPARFPKVDDDDNFWAFKEGMRQCIKTYTTCILEVGDRCWDVMSETMAQRISAAVSLEEEIDLDVAEDNFLITQWIPEKGWCLKLKLSYFD